MTVSIPEVLEKYSVGDSLDDAELKALFEFFEKAEDTLHKLARFYNAGFGLAHRAALNDLQVLESFKNARKRDERYG